MTGRRSGRVVRGSHPRAAPTGRSRATSARRCPSRPRRPARRARSGGPGSARRPGRRDSSSRVIEVSLGIHSTRAPSGSERWRQRAVGRRRRPADPRQRPEGLRGRGGVVGGAVAQQPARLPGDVGPDLLAQSAYGVVVEPLVGEVLTRQPSSAERQRPRDLGLLVGAAGHLQRAAADVEDPQPTGRPAEPPAYGEEGQPRLVLTRRAPRSAARCARRPRRARRRSCRRHGPPRSRTRACPRSPSPPRPAGPAR